METKTEPKTPLFLLFWQNLFKVFASVRLAIPLLTVLIIALIAGTIIESRYGADAGRILVYNASWFSILIVLIAVNLAAAAFDRIPWQKKHIGFVITHLGIIVILAGSLLTQKKMVDGQIILAEGETEHRITLPEPILYIFSEDMRQGWMLPIKKTAFTWTGNRVLTRPENAPFPFEMNLKAFYPKARMTEVFEKAESGPAALKVHLKGSMINQTLRLVEEDPAAGRIPLGPATLVFSKHMLKENEGAVSSSGYLEAEKNGQVTVVSLPKNGVFPAEFSIEDTPYKIKVMKLFKNAVVSGKELIEKPEETENPAVQFQVLGPDVQENHTAFSRFPDFPTTHGMKDSASGFKFFYRLPGTGSRGQRHELRFVSAPDGLKAQIKTGLKVQTVAAEIGKEIPLGWMDLTFKVEEFLPHSVRRADFSPQAPESQAEDVFPALRLEVKGAKGGEVFWLGQGMKHDLILDGKKYAIVFGEKKIPAGFKLKLKDFRVEHYPGTQKPASFESDVVLTDDTRGIVRQETISMNKPLVYRGFHIFQASYVQEEGRPEISVFTAGYDPGVPIKYVGSIIMIAGIVLMFFTRKPAKAASGASEL